MKFDELKLTAQKVIEPPPVVEGELVNDWEETNEAFEALSRPLVVLGDEEKVVFKRCAQCSYFSIVTHCPRCSNHPKLIPVDFAKVSSQMETVGRVCSYFGKKTCIENMALKSQWCGDCLAFWEREWSQRNMIQLPNGINTALLPIKTRQEQQLALDMKDMRDKEEEKSSLDLYEEFEDDLEETQDKLDRACSMLLNLKYLLEFMAEPKKKTIEPQDRRELRDYSTAISELITQCGFDEEGFLADSDIFNERDKELIERIGRRQEELERVKTANNNLNKMMDRVND